MRGDQRLRRVALAMTASSGARLISMATGFISWAGLKQSVREQIFSLPGDTLLCPGHGPLTTVAEEKAHNPFF